MMRQVSGSAKEWRWSKWTPDEVRRTRLGQDDALMLATAKKKAFVYGVGSFIRRGLVRSGLGGRFEIHRRFHAVCSIGRSVGCDGRQHGPARDRGEDNSPGNGVRRVGEHRHRGDGSGS